MSRTAFRVLAQSEGGEYLTSSQIESSALSPGGSTVFLGTSDGRILLLDVTPNGKAGGSEIAALTERSRKVLGKKPIEDICLLPAARRIVALIDGNALLLDSTLVNDHTPLPNCKGARVLAMDQREGYPPRLAVVVKRKVLFFEVRAETAEAAAGARGAAQASGVIRTSSQSFGDPVLVGDAEVPDAVQQLVWVSDYLVLATKQKYLGMKLELGPRGVPTKEKALRRHHRAPVAPAQFERLHVPGAREVPVEGKVIFDQGVAMQVLLMDNVGVMATMSGQPSGCIVNFEQHPQALAQSETHVLAVVPGEGSLQVYHQHGADSVLVQTIPLGITKAPSTLLTDDGQGHVLLVAGRQVVMLAPVSAEEQAREMLKQH
eukprot:gene24344-29578_t